ncbi:hypothetical protein [Legionella quateirensis]|uniref:Cysteine protease domain, YopT-type n=1 Tax=Legionella quateirensis TaxID=45072 RepID=A0A378KSJ5_9GAMM|nr:hypothetical protein [Legionella quateirensis]KTD52902.1 hypothetical protein Lqua_0735 [Legionella quateirensis]STY16368.1 cysteine protease domain, YopT-type [Legionella quateirensis]
MGKTIEKSSPLYKFQEKSAWLGINEKQYKLIAEELILLKKKNPEAVTEFLKNVSAFDYVKLSEAHNDFMSETLLDKSGWLGVSAEQYQEIAKGLISLNKKNPEAVTGFLKNVSAFDYVKLSEAHKDFMSETIFSLDKETQSNYLKALDTSKHGTYNILTRILNFISINFIHFSQTAFAKKSNLLDPSGECMGLTGTWLVTDKFHNNLRQEVNSGVDYSDMPMVRQIAFLQRNTEVKERHNEAFNEKRKPYTEKTKSEIAQNIVTDIVENPQKDRIQFFMRCPKENTGHTTGMRISHLEGGQFKLTYYDPNFGEKRSSAFNNDEDGRMKAAQFIENVLDFTETLSLKSENEVHVSYNIASRADLKKDFDRDANPGPAECKEHAESIKDKLLHMKHDHQQSKEKEKDKTEEASDSAAPGL